MFLNELLISLDCDVTPEPETDKGTRPEYDVKPPSGQPFILEAKTVTGESSAEASLNRREYLLYDELNNRIKTPDFFLKIPRIIRDHKSNPPIKAIATQLQDWLDGLNYDQVNKQYLEHRTRPKRVISINNWELEFGIIPKSERARGDIEIQPVGLFPTKAEWSKTESDLRKALKKKVYKYGIFNQPYIIAIDYLDDADMWEINEALFGKDGVFVDKGSRVSAVIFIQNLRPWTIPISQWALFKNPESDYPCPEILYHLPIAQLSNTSIALKDGLSICEVIEWDTDWSPYHS